MSRIIILRDEARRRRALQVVENIPLTPTPQITIEEYDPKRSDQQNKRYWALIEKVVAETGHDKYEIHDFFRQMFLPGAHELSIGGAVMRVPDIPNTRTMGKRQFREYSDKVEAFCIQRLNIWLEDL
jgi:hypothetical protein